MAFWLHRTTKKYLQNVDAVDLPEPEANYVQDPNIDAMVAARIPQKHWAIDPDDTIRAMLPAEKSAVDQQRDSDRKDQETDRLIDDPVIAFLLAENNLLRTELGRPARSRADLRDSLRNSL